MSPELDLNKIHEAAPHQTGPRTDDGKAASSQNAVKDALFTEEDFIRPGEQPDFDELSDNLLAELTPEGELESVHFDEIVSGTWRLRRCRIIEAALALRAGHDCLLSEEDEKRQFAVDRARNQAHNSVKRATSELRALQTERFLRLELGSKGAWGLTDFRKMFGGIRLSGAVAKMEQRDRQQAAAANLRQALGAIDAAAASFDFSKLTKPVPAPEKPADSFCNSGTESRPANPSPSNSFCKTPQAPPKPGRNQACPCKSGLKYKKCCMNKAA